MTTFGGNYSYGNIYKYNITTGTFTTEVSLDSATGGKPGFGHLTEYVPAAVIELNPTDQYVCAGSTVSFTSSASGRSVTIQWQVSNDGGSTYTDISGASDSIYSFTAYAADSGDLFRTVFTNVMVVDTSTPARLILLQPDTVSQTRTITLGEYLLVGTDTLTTGGTYVDTLMGSHGCDSIVTTYLSVVDGIADVSNYQFNLSPNPTNGSFTITNNYNGTLSVNIINLLGERLKTFTMVGSQQSFDISDLAAGIYEVQICDGNQTLKVMKVVKE
jgi:hypothetical protein